MNDARQNARYVVGIDLGTTHCVVAYADLSTLDEGATPPIALFAIPQLTEPGNVEERELLPSFLYLAAEHDLPEGSLDLAWARGRSYVVGALARNRGAEVPGRVIASAKSWLRHAGVDRTAPILPWEGPPELEKLSPLGATVRYLEHLRDAWNHHFAADDDGARLEHQDVLLTVPASFDAAARDLTARAAEQAGLAHATLLEEPQAAFYAWLDEQGEDWRGRVEVGDRVLVCDVGGGTTDLSLIAVGEQDGELVLERVAVGDHILLGGDNMDLTLAHVVAEKLKADGHQLDAWQLRGLWHSCRAAKEELLTDPDRDACPIVVMGRGSKLIGGTLRTELTAGEVASVLVDGFFPECDVDDEPETKRRTGMRELGLPYEADPAVTRHLAHFLTRHATAGVRQPAGVGGGGEGEGAAASALPTAVLMNGGVMKAEAMRERVVDLLSRWSTDAGGEAVELLAGGDLDRAVARGAAYYGLARRGRGVRIRGGTARSYYIGIESSMPAVPGMPAPLKALCVVPFGMEEGDEAQIPDAEFGLVVGEPAEFRFLGSSMRQDDPVGTLVERWSDEIEELAPITATLPAGELETGEAGATVPVRLHAKVTEVGTLELWCVSRDGRGRWKLEFNVREQDPS
jgi:hypothetical protein